MEQRQVRLDALEQTAFLAAFNRVNRAGFELRSAEADFASVSAVYLQRIGLDPTKWDVNPRTAGEGYVIVVKRPTQEELVKALGAPPAPGPRLVEPPAAEAPAAADPPEPAPAQTAPEWTKDPAPAPA